MLTQILQIAWENIGSINMIRKDSSCLLTGREYGIVDQSPGIAQEIIDKKKYVKGRMATCYPAC